MGFTTGFLGGVTLTATVVYLTLAVHERTRLQQATMLRQQALILDNAIAPRKPAPLSTARASSPGLEERLKERWNRELEGNLRKVYSVDWKGVRETLEDRVAGLWGGAMQSTRDEVEKRT